MIDYSAIQIEKLIIHKVGHKSKDISNQISNNTSNPDDDLSANLINFFLSPFAKQGEVNKFTHHSSLEMNELFSYSKKLFNEYEDFQKISVSILNHLYNQSDHPHIKVGELIIAYFKDIIFDDKITNALGIFKIERKQNYFKLSEHGRNIDIAFDTGIHSRKMDKGCLIINKEENDGYRVLSVDNNNYDTEYWLKKFLSVKYVKDFHYHTSSYVDFCKSFSEKVIENEEGKDKQIAFLNKSMNYLSQKEDFNLDEFAEEVFEEPVQRQKFYDYKQTFEKEQETEIEDNFPIAQNTVKVKKRFIKSLINLDTNIQIKLDPKNPEDTKQFIEKGYDRERDMSYYKVYFYNEMQ